MMIAPLTSPDRAALESIYRLHYLGRTAIAAHLPRLRALAQQCAIVVEFGVKRGASSSALLLGANSVTSYDLVETPEARNLKRVVGDRWDYRIEDSRTASIGWCDLLVIDSLHTYAQMDAELKRHADQVQRYLVCHDTITFGSIAACGETGELAWHYTAGRSVPSDALGIRPAIDELMIRDASWHLAAHYTDHHGLLVLERRP